MHISDHGICARNGQFQPIVRQFKAFQYFIKRHFNWYIPSNKHFFYLWHHDPAASVLDNRQTFRTKEKPTTKQTDWNEMLLMAMTTVLHIVDVPPTHQQCATYLLFRRNFRLNICFCFMFALRLFCSNCLRHTAPMPPILICLKTMCADTSAFNNAAA